ncbi:hypothetical protein TWF281_011492 [Arthrobotrys megalospora]
MSIPVPTEILLDILIKLNRPTLFNVRLVSKKISQAATDILFEELSIHYGIDRSITQMRAVTGSSVRLHIHSLFIPTESFFPFSTTISTSIFAWTRRPPENYPRSQDGDPFKFTPWVDFDVISQYQLYLDTLVDLLEACVNLRSIHIALSECQRVNEVRVKGWSLMFAKVIFPKMARLGITKLNISLPFVGSALSLLSGYGTPCEPYLLKYTGQPIVFPSLKSVCIEVHSLPSMPSQEDIEVGNRMDKFLSSMPNLDSYEIANRLVQPNSLPQILPPSIVKPQLTHLLLKSIDLTEDTLEGFQDLIASIPSLTSLTLIGVVIGLPLEPENDFLSSNRIPSEEFKRPPKINWTDILPAILENLPNLNRFTFRRLMYSYRRGPRMGKIGLLMPMDGNCKNVALGNFNDIAKHYVVISPYESDHVALEEFRRKIRQRNERARPGTTFLKGQKEGESQRLAQAKSYSLWRII